MGGGDVLGLRAVRRDPRRPRPRPGQPGHPGAARRRPPGPDRGVRRPRRTSTRRRCWRWSPTSRPRSTRSSTSSRRPRPTRSTPGCCSPRCSSCSRVDLLRVRNPAPTRSCGWPASSSTTRSSSSSSTPRRSNSSCAARARRSTARRGCSACRCSAASRWSCWPPCRDQLGAVIDAVYGWDPDPEDEGEAAAIARARLTVTLDHAAARHGRPALTLIPVPRGHGGPGMFVGATAGCRCR